MPIPAAQLLVGFANGALDDNTSWVVDAPGVAPAPGHWTDISQYLDHYHIVRGKQAQTGQHESGTLDVVLKNDGGEFNSWSQGGGLFTPFLDLARQVKFRRVIGGQTFDRFTGHLSVVRPLWPNPVSQEAELQGSDLLRLLNGAKLGTLAYVGTCQSLSTNYWRLNEGPGSTVFKPSQGAQSAVATTGQNGQVVAAGGAGMLLATPAAGSVNMGPYDTLGGASTQYTATISAGVSLPAGAWWVGGWFSGMAVGTFPTLFGQMGAYQPSVLGGFQVNVNSFSSGANITALALTAYASGGGSSSFAVGTHNVTDGAPHFIALTYDGSTYRLYVDGQLDIVVTQTLSFPASTGLSIGASLAGAGLGGFSVAEFAVGNTALSAANIALLYSLGVGYASQRVDQRIAAILDTVGVPAAWRNLDRSVQQAQQNTANLVRAPALQALQAAEQTEEGSLYMTGGGIVRLVSRKTLATVAPYAAPQCVFGDRINYPAGIAGGVWAGSALTETQSTFETGVDAAFYTNSALTGPVQSTPATPYQGTKAARWTVGGATGYAFGGGGYVPCRAGDTVAMSAAFNPSAAMSVYLQVTFYDAAFGYLGSVFSAGGVLTAGVWTPATLNAVAPAGTAQYLFFPIVVTSGVVGQTVDMDSLVYTHSTASSQWGSARWGSLPSATWGAAGAWGSAGWGVGDIAFDPSPDIGLDDMNIVSEPDVTRVGGTVQANYAVSPYGPHQLSRSNVLHLTDAASFAHATWLLNKYGASRTELRKFKVDLTGILPDTAALQRVMALDLMYQVRVLRSTVAFQQTGLIEHIDEVGSAHQWEITFGVSAADAYPNWYWNDTQ